jgi:tetratricopeptide (TPR) repeat protein
VKRRTNTILSALIFLCFLGSQNVYAQSQSSELIQARTYADLKDYAKAKELFKKLYEKDAEDEDVYSEYLNVLIADKSFKDAEKLAARRVEMRPMNPLLLLDLGRVYLAQGKDKKAEDKFDEAVNSLTGDDMLTTRMANAFSAMGSDKYAVKTYEAAKNLLRNPFLYSSALARLYSKTGETDKGVNALLDGGPGQIGGLDEIKATLLELLGTDAKKLQQGQKALIKRISDQPENIYYTELLTWLYTQKDDWDGAFIQIRALDERNKENGQRLIEFARTAAKEKKWDIAIRSLDAVIERGQQQAMYAIARADKLNTMMDQLEDNPFFKPEDVSKLQGEYQKFFEELPQYFATETLRDYARLEAQFAGNPEKAIGLLKKAITEPSARRDFVGWAKLQLGDYLILTGKIWDASLSYSQVDKDFREDMLGEEARFRNAKLAYYRGDFEWAQGQLSVLKASTSELIANDALYLSVLITENIPPDSNYTPLRRFAYSDLLLFQNRDAEATTILDSIAQAFPKHPLSDDILLLHAKISEKHREYSKALAFLEKIYKEHGDDVLGDDAVFKTAEIYEKYLNQKDEAKNFYEKLVLDYPGSTYVQTARVRLAELQPAPLP